MTRLSEAKTIATTDQALADIMDQVSARLHAGEQLQLGDLLTEYPEHAQRLTQLWPALRLLANASQSSQTPVTWPQVASIADEPTSEPLGDFRLIRELGRGGMGVVYEATQLSLNRRVALKVLPFAATMDPKHLQRFRNEAMAAASLRHENIVHVYGVGCERSVHFYAMEMIDGQTLAQIIAALHHQPEHSNATSDSQPASAAAPTAPVGALSTEFAGIKGREFHRLAARLIADAADALEHAHSLGIVHRDIKPGNLMLDDNGHLWVTDFGLAKLEANANMTMTGDLIGTLKYMSPEQAMARHGLVDHRTDIYSLGATLYELLTLQPAVDGADKQEILKKIAFEDPAALRKLDRSIPVELETITLKCLAKNPNERYASAGELAADLRRWSEDKPIKARPPGWRQQLGRWVRRHKPVVWSAGLACIGLAVATILVLSISNYRISQEKDAKETALHDKEQARATAQANFEKADYERQRAQRFFHRSRVAVSTLFGLMGSNQKEWREMPVTLRKKLTAGAVNYYQQFLKEVSDDPEIRFEAGWANWQIALMQSRFPNEIGDARESYRRAIAILEPLTNEYPRVDKYRQHLGYTRRMLGKQLAKEHPEEAEALLRLSVKDYDLYIQELGGTEFGEWASARNDLCSHLAKTQRIEEAKKLDQQTIELMDAWAKNSPENKVKKAALSHLYGARGLGHAKAGRLTEAEAFYQRAVELNPKNAATLNNLANIYHETNRLSEAESAYRRAIKAQPDIITPYLNLAGVLRQTDRYADALEMSRRAAEVAKQLAVPEIAAYERDVGDDEILVAAVERLPELLSGATLPANAQEQIALALAFHCKGKRDAAAKWFEQAFTADPELADEHYCFTAASDAFLVGFAMSGDSSEFSDDDRTHWRHKARSWMAATISALAKRAEIKVDRPYVRGLIGRMENITSYSQFRSSKTYINLPEAERAAWAKLWADFDAVKKRCNEGMRAAEPEPPER